MELRLKKRIVGFLLLIGLALIIIPIFFGHSAPSDELQLSGRIPPAPEKPESINLALPPASATVPAPVDAKVNDASNASRMVFEQVQSTVGNDSASNAPAPVAPKPITQSATPVASNTIAPASSITSPVVPTKPITSVNGSNNSNTVPASPAVTNTVKTIASTSKGHKSQAAKIASSSAVFVVQMGSFSAKINAENLVKKLQAKGFAAYIQTNKTAEGSSMIKVLVGPQLRRSDAIKVQTKIHQEFNLQGIVIKAGI